MCEGNYGIRIVFWFKCVETTFSRVLAIRSVLRKASFEVIGVNLKEEIIC